MTTHTPTRDLFAERTDADWTVTARQLPNGCTRYTTPAARAVFGPRGSDGREAAIYVEHPGHIAILARLHLSTAEYAEHPAPLDGMTLTAAEAETAILDAEHPTGYACKRCGGPAPIGVGYYLYRSLPAGGADLQRCGCGYSQRATP